MTRFISKLNVPGVPHRDHVAEEAQEPHDAHVDHDDHDAGLQADVSRLLSRRRALGLLGGAGAAGLLAGCGEAEVTASAADGSKCVAHPWETAGPYPADGSNHAHGTLANVLDDSGILRADLRPDIEGGPETAAAGAELRLTLRLVDVQKGCAPLAGYALYLWHCDAAGRYSLYDLPERSHLRGVGVADAAGEVRFATILPGCYRGRYPHCHFEVYPSIAAATDYRARVLTSQLAIPAEACAACYGLDAYEGSVQAFRGVSLERDGIFRDNSAKQVAAQTPALTGDPQRGFDGLATIGLKI